MKNPIRIAIFASGNGSNAENIVNYFKDNTSIIIVSIYTNKENAYVIKRAKNLNIECKFFANSIFREGGLIIEELESRNIDFIILAGFLLKIPENIILKYPKRIINIHPALLPKFGGKGMYGDRVHIAVKEAGEKESGITIHYVNECFDDGEIIFQAKVEIKETDTADDIANKVHALEYEHFPRIIESVINN